MAAEKRQTKKEGNAISPVSDPIAGEPEGLDLPTLVQRIADIHYQLVKRATKAVNTSLTLRNWLIGLSLQNYELEGKDRATYGDRLFSTLSNDLTLRGVSNCSRRQLYHYRDFYLAYPHIVGSLNSQLQDLIPHGKDFIPGIVGSLNPQSWDGSRDLLSCLSYTHFEELVAIEDPLKRTFYEGECIRGNWSIRDVQLQNLEGNGGDAQRATRCTEGGDMKETVPKWMWRMKGAGA